MTQLYYLIVQKVKSSKWLEERIWSLPSSPSRGCLCAWLVAPRQQPRHSNLSFSDSDASAFLPYLKQPLCLHSACWDSPRESPPSDNPSFNHVCWVSLLCKVIYPLVLGIRHRHAGEKDGGIILFITLFFWDYRGSPAEVESGCLLRGFSRYQRLKNILGLSSLCSFCLLLTSMPAFPG